MRQSRVTQATMGALDARPVALPAGSADVGGLGGVEHDGIVPIKNDKDPHLRAFSKRLKGLEPSTFCMASRRSSQLSYSRKRGGV